MIAKLQENQEAITNKLDDQEAAMTQVLLTQQQLLLPWLSQQPALATAAETRAATPTTPRQPIDINLEAGLDLRLLQENGLQRLSKLVNSDLKELTTLDKLKSLVGKRRGTTLLEGERKELENLSESLSNAKTIWNF